MSEIAEKIDSLVQMWLAPALRDLSFKGSGRTFYRARDSLVQVINVQASTSNVGAAGRFTLNLGLYFPEVQRLLDPERVQLRPKEYECTVRARISQALGQNTDLWWQIEPQTDMRRLGNEVANALMGAGIAWLEANSDLNVAVDCLRHQAVPHSAALLALGRRAEAEQVIASAVEAGGPASAYHRRWGSKHGLL